MLRKILRQNRRARRIMLISLCVLLLSAAFGIFADPLAFSNSSTPVSYIDLLSQGNDHIDEYVSIDVVYTYSVAKGYTGYGSNRKSYVYFVAFDSAHNGCIVMDSAKGYEELLENLKSHTPQTLTGFLRRISRDRREEIMDELSLRSKSEYVQQFGSTYLKLNTRGNTLFSTILTIVYYIISVSLLSLIISLLVWRYTASKIKKALSRFDRKTLEYELSKPTCQAYPELNLYLTDRYLISTQEFLDVVEYRSIALIAASEANHLPCVHLNLRPLAFVCLTFHNSAVIDWLIDELRRRNPTIMIGYTPENSERYQNMV